MIIIGSYAPETVVRCLQSVTLHRNGGGQKVGLTLCYGSPCDGFTDVFVGEVSRYLLCSCTANVVWLYWNGIEENSKFSRSMMLRKGTYTRYSASSWNITSETFITCTPTRSSAIGMSHTCLCLPTYNWYSFTDPGGTEGWVGLGGWLRSETVYLPEGSHPSHCYQAQSM